MSNVKDSNNYSDWLKKEITNEHLDCFEYSEFKNIQPIGNGAFGSVFRAYWESADTIVALKSFNNQKSTLKEIVNELKLHRKVHFHANILRFYGITKTETNMIHHYSLVLEYADSGTLKAYLNENFNELKWDDKLRLALQLANAILCLHGRNIIHRDLHAENILVHQENIKLAVFGLSKKIDASSDTSKIFGVLPYIDPKKICNKNYRLNKKSDIYSIGVIMWQISSGRRPFYAEDIEYDVCLALSITDGERETIIDGTPNEYSNLYTKCWNNDPNERPNIQEVVSTLKSITSKRNNDNINEEKENHLLVKNNYNVKLSEVIRDLNSDLIVKSESNSDLDIGALDHITVQIDELPLRHVLVCLRLEDQLSKTRKILEQNCKIKMDNTLSFAKKISKANALAEIAKKDEENMRLEDIIDDKILYLKPEFDKKRFLIYKCKLDYGCTITDLGTVGKANKRAFTMEDYEILEIDDGFLNDTIEIELKKDWIVKINLFLAVETSNVQDFAQLGISIENFKKSNVVTNCTYNISECSKVSLKFKELKPTEEFINDVKVAIKSKSPWKFEDIIKEFGQFIPKEVILGGRALFKRSNLSEYPEEVENNINGGGPMIRVGMPSLIKNFTKNSSRHRGFKLIGGEKFSPKDFDEQAWIGSLKDFRNWDCIRFKNPISIFHLLSKDLRKEILKLIGKKILYTNTEDYFFKLSQPGMPQTIEIRQRIPKNILEILQNEDAECNIFATVMDTEMKTDTFNCQILCPSNEDPILMIHFIQEKFKKCECDLKIRLMIIGYDINFNFNQPNFNVQLKVQKHEFNSLNCQTSKLDLDDSSDLCFGIPVLRKLDSSNNSVIIGHHFFEVKKNKKTKKIGLYIFSYCLKENHYVDLPDFIFYTLIISNHPNSGILPFKHFNFKDRIISNFTKSNPLPKYISLYSTGENNCGPIFLIQRTHKIKIKYITTSCDKDDCICKNNALKKSENNLKYAFFDPS